MKEKGTKTKTERRTKKQIIRQTRTRARTRKREHVVHKNVVGGSSMIWFPLVAVSEWDPRLAQQGNSKDKDKNRDTNDP